MAFSLFLALAVIFSFWLAAIYKKTQCVFACSVFDRLINTLLSVFVIKPTIVLILGFGIMLIDSIYLWHDEANKANRLSD